MVQTEMFAAPGAKRPDFDPDNRQTQNKTILAALRRGERLSDLDAQLRYGCGRLAARVENLRKAGHAITMEWATTKAGNRYGVYSLDLEG